MAQVFIPPLARNLTGGRESVAVAGGTVGQVLEQLEQQFPGLKDRLCQGNELKPGLAVAIDARVGQLGLREKVEENSEVHFLPAIGGG